MSLVLLGFAVQLQLEQVWQISSACLPPTARPGIASARVSTIPPRSATSSIHPVSNKDRCCPPYSRARRYFKSHSDFQFLLPRAVSPCMWNHPFPICYTPLLLTPSVKSGLDVSVHPQVPRWKWGNWTENHVDARMISLISVSETVTVGYQRNNGTHVHANSPFPDRKLSWKAAILFQQALQRGRVCVYVCVWRGAQNA